jgi:magnesium transporter
MSSNKKKLQVQERLGFLSDAISDGTLAPVVHMLNGLKPQDIAQLLESSPPKLREAIWALVEVEDEGEILQYLSEEVQTFFLQSMDATEVLAVTEGLETDDIADILQLLPDTIIQEVMASMDHQDRHRVERVINYGESIFVIT